MALTTMKTTGNAVKLCWKELCAPHPYLHKGELETVMIDILFKELEKPRTKSQNVQQIK